MMSRGLLLAMALYATASLAQPQELVLWHSMAGNLGDEVGRLAAEFNQSQSDYTIKPVYKGEYTDSLTSFAAAFRAHKPPAMVQVFEVGTASMLSPQGIVKPLDELMREQKIRLPEEDFLPAVRAFYSKSGRLQAMPFNISVPLIYYNADALAQVGVNEGNFPATWQGLEQMAKTLQQAGHACVYTSAYPAWIQIESFSALHGLPLVNQRHQAVYNHPAQVTHIERLQRWQEKHWMAYGGRTSDATVLFTSGHCVLFSQSSGSYVSMAKLSGFRLGVAPLPMDAALQTSRHNNVSGGAALWAVAGQSQQTYRGIARFYAFLAKPDVQWRWHQRTGYIPLGLTGVYAPGNGVTAQPTLAIARVDLMAQQPLPFSPYRIPLNQIRMINDQALEAVFAGLKSASLAMNDAVQHADRVMKRFLRNAGEEEG